MLCNSSMLVCMLISQSMVAINGGLLHYLDMHVSKGLISCFC